ncbi:hypothetical protein A3J13_00830 [Candidatus Daviesbacteria bacterium RIFCSPLOWO2_02_FULL_36_8]|uniref:Uncharacterized protein n=1 Tax=Candidatus Daviesbacteria bacterium RIFCSPLOWO2_02_FULL_36_8 TaxID=1797793 RepID=A0A1F5MH48_9BACT|nr:MAG: hypothetical protein A3J13_00830 [Candidatus Daviesbacteria bacterium RIFCSPLOWO2_02_FULL_36_8]
MNTAVNFDDKLRENVVPHAQTYDPTFNQDKATPSDSKPVLDKELTGEAKAENVGFEELSEEVESKNRDLKAILKNLFMPFVGGTEKREGPLGKIWNKMERLKIQRHVKQKDEHDPDQEIE